MSFSGVRLGVEHRLQQLGRALGVDAHVAADLVHRLADADGGREVEDHIDAGEDFAQAVGIAHVADDQLDLGREIVRAAPSGCTCGVRSSRMRTLWPAARRPSARWEPTKPAPPVIRICLLIGLRSLLARFSEWRNRATCAGA